MSKRGKKAQEGTLEARNKINILCDAISACELSQSACDRAIKALKFGLGIKEESNNIVEEKKKSKKEKKNKKEIENKISNAVNKVMQEEGDEYFSPEDCQPVDY